MNKKLICLILISFFSFACTKIKKQESKNRLSEILSAEASNKFKKAIELRKFTFPRDHFAHRNYQTEWWYFTGNLENDSKRHFGYQLTIFRNGIDPKLNRDIYMGHLAISDVKNKKFYSYEIFEDEIFALAGVDSNTQEIWLNDWNIKFSGDQIQITAKEGEIALDLKMKTEKEITLQGEQGLSKKNAGEGNASYYYSITNLKTTGIIEIADESYKVKGKSWLDREWSTSVLSKEQAGWDWFSLQFDNETELMFYQLRNKDGSIDLHSSGSFVDQSSEKRKVSIDDIEINKSKTCNYKSREFPCKWEIASEKLGIDIAVTPYFEQQWHEFDIEYWEGAVRVEGSHSGSGYVEMTGY